MESSKVPFRSGLVAIIGRSNVGKSTLMNALVGQKVTIVSAKPHTTRHRLLGILTNENFQIGLLDTPGFLKGGRDLLDTSMSRESSSALSDANAIILVVEPRLPGDIELNLVNQIKKSGKNALLVLNKIDTIPKNKLLPVIQKYSDIHSFQEIFPVSSITSEGLDSVVTSISNAMPQREALFPADALTDRSVRFLVGELIRERVFNLYRHEIPYDVAIEIEDFDERADGARDYIRAVIYVDKPSQKQLLIGGNGSALKLVGVDSRPEIEKLVGKPVYLDLWVKINPKWRNKAGFIQKIL